MSVIRLRGKSTAFEHVSRSKTLIFLPSSPTHCHHLSSFHHCKWNSASAKFLCPQLRADLIQVNLGASTHWSINLPLTTKTGQQNLHHKKQNSRSAGETQWHMTQSWLSWIETWPGELAETRWPTFSCILSSQNPSSRRFSNNSGSSVDSILNLNLLRSHGSRGEWGWMALLTRCVISHGL